MGNFGPVVHDMTALPQSDAIDNSVTARVSNYNRNKKWAKQGPYVTKLNPQQESQFQQWVKKNNIPWRDSPTADYDMRGYWLAQQKGNPVAVRAKNLHFPDQWKTPYDATFSNESQYATKEAPHWVGNKLVMTPAPDSSFGAVTHDPQVVKRKDSLITRGWNWLWNPLAGKSYAKGWTNPDWAPSWEKKIENKAEATGSPALAAGVSSGVHLLAQVEGVGAQLTSPGSLALLIMSCGDSVLGKIGWEEAGPAIKSLKTASAVSKLATGASFGAQGALTAVGRGMGAFNKKLPAATRAQYASQALAGASMALFSSAGMFDQVKSGMRGFLRRQFGLDDDLAKQVADQVADKAQARATRAAAEASKHSYQTGAASYEARISGETAQVDAALAKSVNDLQAEVGTKIDSVTQEIKERGEKIAADLDANEAAKARAGSKLVSSSIEAVQRMKEKVQQPFEELGNKTTKPVTTEANLRSIVDNRQKEFGIQDQEVPSSIFKSLPPSPESETTGMQSPATSSETAATLMARKLLKDGESLDDVKSILRNLGYVAPKQLSRIIALAAPDLPATGLGFNEITHFRDAVWNAASTAGFDTPKGGFLMSVYHDVSDMQEKYAEDNGFGAEYQKAKADYTQFKRNVGTGTMQKFLADYDADDQELSHKLKMLIDSEKESNVMRSMFKWLGIDTKDFDASVKAGDDLEAIKKKLPSEEKLRIRSLKAQATEAQKNLEDIAKRRKAELGESVEEAYTQAKEASTRADEAVEAAEKQETEAEKAGAKIVPAKATSDLVDLTQKQLEAERIRATMDQMKRVGITNPWRLALVGIGLVRLALGSYWGMFEIGIGGVPLALDKAAHSPAFQDHIIQLAGAEDAPPAVQEGIRGWLNKLGTDMRKMAKTQVPSTIQPAPRITPAPPQQQQQAQP